MESKKQQKASLSKSDDNPTPMKTLAQLGSNILVGTLVWGKFKDWPWWPGKIIIKILKNPFQLSLIAHYIHPRYRCDCDQC